MKFKTKLRLIITISVAISLFAGIFLGLLWAIPTAAKAPYNQSDYSDDIIRENAIQAAQSNTIPDKQVLAIKPKAQVSTSTSYSGRHYSKEEVIQLIKDYSARYGIDSALPLRVAQCESGFRWDAKNKSSSASGVFEYLASTWAGTDEGKAGLSVFDADANVRAAIKYIASRGNASPWLASKTCWQ